MTRSPDPMDLGMLRRRLAGDGHPRNPIGLGTVRIGSDALDALPDDVARVRRDGPVVIVVDRTPMTRRGVDLKRLVVERLAERFEVRLAVIGHDGELHADERALAEADRAIAGAGCVVSVGSGTITDVAKDASYRAGGLPFVVVQTAVSVNAFSDDMAVLLRDGVKRTVPSRWPDVLIADLDVLAEAPPDMNRAGLGELCSMFTAPADWYLAGAIGMDDTWDPDVVALFRDGAEALLDGDLAGPGDERANVAELAGRMTLTGIAMGVAGRTAPLSGTEHLISHLIDMAAAAENRPAAFHGAQVGAASVLAALVWEDALDTFDPACLALPGSFPAAASIEPRVRDAFIRLDPSGRMAAECWRDVSRKLDRWHAARRRVEAFAAAWPEHRAALQRLLVPADRLAAALGTAGAARRFRDLDPPAAAVTVRWALEALPLMRDRFTVVDLFALTGRWDAAAIDRLLDRAAALGAGL